MITKRSEWRTLKDKHGIPDKVCAFSMGERIEKAHKASDAASAVHDYKAKVAALDALIKDFKAYENALKTIKASKFKGKTAAEQAKNLQDVRTAVQHEITFVETLANTVRSYAEPLAHLKQVLPTVRGKLNTLTTGDLAAVKTFYESDYRNNLGKYVAAALKQHPTGKLKTALEAYVSAGDVADELVDDCAEGDLPGIAKVIAACKMGVEGLATVI